MPSPELMVLVGNRFACVKVSGRANFTLAVDFKTLVAALVQKGCAYFVIDLAECLLMDSTFLGVLAGLGLKMNPADSESGGQAVELLNPNQRIVGLLESLGVLQLFKISQGSFAAPESLEACSHEPAHPSREELTRASLEAHETLMAIHPANAAKFKEVARFLAEDLQKLTGNS
jgi:anti-sigma B factor antagonist